MTFGELVRPLNREERAVCKAADMSHIRFLWAKFRMWVGYGIGAVFTND